jgi:hypothetical protein
VSADHKDVSSPVFLMVCDYAAVKDGSCTIVRGGIDSLSAASLPVNMLAWLYVEVNSGALSLGDHDVKTSIKIGEMKLFEVDAMLKVADAEARPRFAIPVACSVQSFGPLQISVSIGPLRAERVILLKQLVDGEGGAH